MAIQGAFFKFRPIVFAEPIRVLENKALIDEILQHPDLKDFEKNHLGTIILEVPDDLLDLGISPKLKKLLVDYKGQIVGFQV
jgi:hypothetical protein